MSHFADNTLYKYMMLCETIHSVDSWIGRERGALHHGFFLFPNTGRLLNVMVLALNNSALLRHEHTWNMRRDSLIIQYP